MRAWALDRPTNVVCESCNTEACYCTFNLSVDMRTLLSLIYLTGYTICWIYALYGYRGGIKSPWSRRKRKRALSREQWERLFSANGKLRDGGKKFLKKVRSGVSTVFIHFHPYHPDFGCIRVGYPLYVVKYTVMSISLVLWKVGNVLYLRVQLHYWHKCPSFLYQGIEPSIRAEVWPFLLGVWVTWSLLPIL